MITTVTAADCLYLEEKEMDINNGSTLSKNEGHSPFFSCPLKKQRLQQKWQEYETREKLPPCAHNDVNERDFIADDKSRYNSSAPPLSAAPVLDNEWVYDHENSHISRFLPPLRVR